MGKSLDGPRYVLLYVVRRVVGLQPTPQAAEAQIKADQSELIAKRKEDDRLAERKRKIDHAREVPSPLSSVTISCTYFILLSRDIQFYVYPGTSDSLFSDALLHASCFIAQTSRAGPQRSD